MQVLDNVNLNLDDPRNPVVDLNIPIYILREEEFTSANRLVTPKEFLFRTIDKSFTLTQSRNSNRYSLTVLNVQTLKLELSQEFKIKKKCVNPAVYKLKYDNQIYHYIKAVFFVMNDKYYYRWKAKYRDMLLQQILN
jgi:hypothetical protein